MGARLDLDSLLRTLVGSGKVYFQPPTGLAMVYPCITYERYAAKTLFGDNNPYLYEQQYQLTIIYKDPDSPISDNVAKLPKCTFDRHFKADNLNHDVFTIYF